MKLIRFLEGRVGRVVRGAAGLALISLGAWLGGPWWVLVPIGLVPLAAGTFGICLAAAVFHAPVRHAHRGA